MKTIIFLAFGLLTFTSFSQIEKDKMFISGQLNLNIDNNQFRSFGLTPSFGYMITDKWALGAQLRTSYVNTNVDDFTIGAGFIARRYFPIVDKFYFSLNGSLNYVHLNREFDGTHITNSGNGFGVGVQPMFTFFPSPKWALEAGIGSIGYNYMNLEGSGSGTFNLQYGSISLGFAYFFGKGN